MPTFFDSTADAAEASESLRGLAHASRTFDQPAQMYGVIGDLSSGMRSLHQVLEQLADVHERKAAHAFNDDGDHAAGVWEGALGVPRDRPEFKAETRRRLQKLLRKIKAEEMI